MKKGVVLVFLFLFMISSFSNISSVGAYNSVEPQPTTNTVAEVDDWQDAGYTMVDFLFPRKTPDGFDVPDMVYQHFENDLFSGSTSGLDFIKNSEQDSYGQLINSFTGSIWFSVKYFHTMTLHYSVDVYDSSSSVTTEGLIYILDYEEGDKIDIYPTSTSESYQSGTISITKGMWRDGRITAIFYANSYNTSSTVGYYTTVRFGIYYLSFENITDVKTAVETREYNGVIQKRTHIENIDEGNIIKVEIPDGFEFNRTEPICDSYTSGGYLYLVNNTMPRGYDIYFDKIDEGAISGYSISSFSETVSDDAWSPIDLGFSSDYYTDYINSSDDVGSSYGWAGLYSNTYYVDGTYIWYAGEDTGDYNLYRFEIPQATQIEMVKVSIYAKVNDPGSSDATWYYYKNGWEDTGESSGSSWGWVNFTVYTSGLDSFYVRWYINTYDTGSVSLYVDYIHVEYYAANGNMQFVTEQELENSYMYWEDFSDISDWVFYAGNYYSSYTKTQNASSNSMVITFNTDSSTNTHYLIFRDAFDSMDAEDYYFAIRYRFYQASSDFRMRIYIYSGTTAIANFGSYRDDDTDWHYVYPVTNDISDSFDHIGIELSDAYGNSPSTTFQVEIDYIYFSTVPLRDAMYHESFADVSDWTFATKTSGVSSHSITTNGDVCDFSVSFDGSYTGSDYIYYYVDLNMTIDTTDSSDSDKYMYFNYYISEDHYTYIYLRLLFSDGGSNLYEYVVHLTETSWRTVFLDLSWIAQHYRTLWDHYELYRIKLYMNDGPDDQTQTAHLYMDYIRIADASEIGYQDDCSSDYQWQVRTSYNGTISSDGDIVTLTADDSYDWFEWYPDKTTTQSNIYIHDFTFLQVHFNDDSIGSKCNLAFYDEVGTWHTISGDFYISQNDYYYNLRAFTTGNYLTKLLVAAFNYSNPVKIDYIKLYGIANFYIGYSHVNGYSIAYVENGVLHNVQSTGYKVFYQYRYISINTTIYNVFNVSADDNCYTGDYFKFTYSDGHMSDARYFTRGLTQYAEGNQPVITDYYFTLRTTTQIKNITFISTRRMPLIERVWIYPDNPVEGEDVSIYVAVFSTMKVYSVYAEDMQTGDIYTFTCDRFENNVGTYSYSGTFSLGTHFLKVIAEDIYSSDYQYLSFNVREAEGTGYIRIFNNQWEYVPFESFEIYVNGSRQYTDIFEIDMAKKYNITIKDRWGQTLNSTIFPAGTIEFAVQVNVYNLKVMNWYEGFVFFNLTHGGVTYTEVLTPLETVAFDLYIGSYTYSIDYRNGTTISGSMTFDSSTALICTGNTIADLMNMNTRILNMTQEINITVVNTNNQVITLTFNLDNVNSTLYNQTINILLNVQNSNTTLYQQTISILSEIENTNSTIYAQTIEILSNIENVNSTLYSQTIEILSQIQNMNSTLYNQTVYIMSELQNLNSTLYSMYVNVSLSILNNNTVIITTINNRIAQVLATEQDQNQKQDEIYETLSTIQENPVEGVIITPESAVPILISLVVVFAILWITYDFFKKKYEAGVKQALLLGGGK